MRFNLKVPYAQKDAAKELGARWDAARKIWYVMDPQSIEVFSDWVPQEQNEATGGAPPSVNAKPAAKRAGVFTGPAVFKPLCHCNVLPWEHCPHTEHT